MGGKIIFDEKIYDLKFGNFQWLDKIMENRKFKLPSFQEWGKERPLKDSQPNGNSMCIKFSVISNESLPFLEQQKSPSLNFMKHFKKKK